MTFSCFLQDETKTRASTFSTPKVYVENYPLDDKTDESLVRHSEFYKGSKISAHDVIRRRSADNAPSMSSSTPLQERRPTLVDIMQEKDGRENVSSDVEIHKIMSFKSYHHTIKSCLSEHAVLVY